jgi:hypothetical protein
MMTPEDKKAEKSLLQGNSTRQAEGAPMLSACTLASFTRSKSTSGAASFSKNCAPAF